MLLIASYSLRLLVTWTSDINWLIAGILVSRGKLILKGVDRLETGTTAPLNSKVILAKGATLLVY